MNKPRKEVASTQAGSHPAFWSWSLVLILAPMILSACAFAGLGNRQVTGSGNLVSTSLPLDDFQAVELQFDGDLVVGMGEHTDLIIEAEENLLPHLEALVIDDTLTIRKVSSNVRLKPTAPIHYYLTVTELESLTTTSSGSIEAAALETDRLLITTKSSGSVYLGRLDAAYLNVTIQAEGDVIIAGGKVEEQAVILTGLGSYDGRELPSLRAKALLSSSGEAILSVRDRLDADLSSSGNLYYIGNPTVNMEDSSSEGQAIHIHE